MSDLKQVKVDNWGIFFLQRLKHFFNRTDYCDLTLQFQDNAQLKVHRLVLSACTEYFELLERTCEMYEDCLVMPDDLQADVVVPIVNFMYTGQLEFKMDLLERLYQTSLVMNMPVLTKLLDAHRNQPIREAAKRYTKSYNSHKTYSAPSSSNATNNKRSYGKAFENNTLQKYKKPGVYDAQDLPFTNPNLIDYQPPVPKKHIVSDPRPTRYELPEELEDDNLFDNSFTNISYTSKPLMVHPETTKHYRPKRSGIFEDPSTSKTFVHGRSTIDIVECKKISPSDHIFDDDQSEIICDDQSSFPQPTMSVKNEPRDASQLFDQILDGGPKVTIETKDSKQASNLDHAKIISEVLKKYPHLVKSNKNIKLKILNTPNKKKTRPTVTSLEDEKETKTRNKSSDYAFETEVIDSKEAAKLIAMGAENIKGPWICLLCGAPGKAIHFSSYYKFRRHLVDVHNEKPVLNICEYCGQRTMKRNYLLHHLYTKHGIEPPPQYNFPKCNVCNYIALTERYLIKHKLSHAENKSFRCYVCNATFSASNQLLIHIQKTGHKYSADRKSNLQCVYCLKVFLRENNLYAHIRATHKEMAKNDGIIDISDEENEVKEPIVTPPSPKQKIIKYELPISFDNECDDADIQYQIQQQPDGNIQVVTKKPRILLPAVKHKILNSGFNTPSTSSKVIQSIQNTSVTNASKQNEFVHNTNISIDNSQSEEIVMIDNNEYIVKNNNLIPKKEKMMAREDFFMPDMMHTDIEETTHNIIPTTSIEYTNVPTANIEHKMIVKKSSDVNQPVQIVVSNEEQYKALMTSNHSIIFEDEGTNKTLTVLTAPHDNNMTTTIDLNNTQSNDMMIIPDDYPLNVSEAVPGDNSNIVVVYSHPVDDQNKEYQLITSQNFGAQFVTTSGIITQNYETVTTSAPVMSANVIEAPVEDSWQNSMAQNIASDTEMEISSQVTITPLNSEQRSLEDQYTTIENEQRSLDTQQEIQLPPMDSDSVEIHTTAEHEVNDRTLENSITEPHVIDNLNETNTIIITDGSQQDIVINSETQPVFIETITRAAPTPNVNEDYSKNIVEEEKTMTDLPNEDLNNDKDSIISEENIQLENISIVHEAEAENSPDQHILDSEKDIQNINSEESTESETVENISKAIQSSAPVSSNTKSNTAVINEHINNEVSLIKAKEQIQNLTSEWSDDEMETLSQQQSSPHDDNLKNVTESEAMETESQPELEESVENIQQEMEKQLIQPVQTIILPQSDQPITMTEDITNVLNNDNISNIQETEPVNKTVVANETNKTPDKISSLLNDWEDNDSQEEDIPITIENKEATESKTSAPTEDTENISSVDVSSELPITNKPDTKADENIKSLVSDWVEEDEDETDNK